VSEPLTTEQLNTIGWKNRQAVNDGRTFYNYYRLTADSRILWGAGAAKYHSHNSVSSSHDFSLQQKDVQLASFRRHFPQLASLTFPYAWGGPIASTTRLTPFVGELQGGFVLYALGYTGQGVLNSRLISNVLAHKALGRVHELLDLQIIKKKPLFYPPEPFRTLAIKIVSKSLRKVDAGGKPNILLRTLDKLSIGFSS
jgi:glycine/D-amino acid oxidase-like deaminating enzyme